ncbi:MAG TPA: LuxR C-terminal-related transcriptional regulator, partial [Acidimicrobiales bacterium]|nr:LuxR C-terminal-related transcriptional regulator [Acidimicrobiales bacterium]
TAAAVAAIRSGRARLGAKRSGGRTRPFVTVSHVPTTIDPLSPSGLVNPETVAGTANGTSSGNAHHQRLARRVVTPIADPEVESMVWEPVGSQRTTNGSDPTERAAPLHVLVVGTEETTGPFPRFSVEAVATVVKRAGAHAMISPSSEPDRVLLDLYVTQPQVAVVVVEHEPLRRRASSSERKPWEQPAQLVRTLRDAGIPVVAVGMGATAAAIAACIEQGATGLLDPVALPRELALFSDLALQAGHGNGHSKGDLLSAEARRSLPAPYAALIDLTPSERRVLRQMMEGRAAADIAESLVVSLPTVRSHIRSILRKLNVNSQLAAVAIANGALPDESVSA